MRSRPYTVFGSAQHIKPIFVVFLDNLHVPHHHAEYRGTHGDHRLLRDTADGREVRALPRQALREVQRWRAENAQNEICRASPGVLRMRASLGWWLRRSVRHRPLPSHGVQTWLGRQGCGCVLWRICAGFVNKSNSWRLVLSGAAAVSPSPLCSKRRSSRRGLGIRCRIFSSKVTKLHKETFPQHLPRTIGLSYSKGILASCLKTNVSRRCSTCM